MRWLGVDFGERRIGLAISDEAGRIALPHSTLRRTSDRQAARAIAELARREAVGRLVVGEPRRLDGTAGEAALRTRRFATRLAAETGLPCDLLDEALTSVAAAERLREAGTDPRRHPERLDAVAAQLLLQEALDREAAGA
jgi:putative Holliday junction resolvase